MTEATEEAEQLVDDVAAERRTRKIEEHEELIETMVEGLQNEKMRTFNIVVSEVRRRL